MEEHEEAIRQMAREEHALLGEYGGSTFEEALDAWRVDGMDDILEYGVEPAVAALGMERCEEIFNDAYLRAAGGA